MGLFDSIFKKPAAKEPDKVPNTAYQTLTAYSPMISFGYNSPYEAELIRAAIDTLARNNGKLKVEFTGSAKPSAINLLKKRPNKFQTWYQCLYRLTTILYLENTAFLVPVYDDEYGRMTGIYPILPSYCTLIEYKGEPWIKCTFPTGKTAAERLANVGIMVRYYYKDDFFGESNNVQTGTMELIELQNKSLKEAVKNSNTYRFMAQLSNFAKEKDLGKEMKRFNDTVVQQDISGGTILFPNTYSNIQQVQQTSYTLDADQNQMIKDRVYSYYGVNDDVVLNKAFGDAWSAFYEGAVEPFAIQLAEVLRRMLFTELEQSTGNDVVVSANRLQYMTNHDKLSVVSQLLDRGVFSVNEGREVFNLPPVEGGDVRTIRGEYKNADDIGSDTDDTEEEDEADAEH